MATIQLLDVFEVLLGIYRVVLAGLLVLSVLIGVFPLVVVCDDGNILRCLGSGLLFFLIPAGISAATFGGAILAMKRPCFLSRLFLLVDGIAIILLAVWLRYYGDTVPFFSWVIGTLGLLPLFGAALLRADESDEGESSS